MIFDWDDANILHIARHKVTPEEAEYAVINDPIELPPQVVNGEERFPLIGETRRGRILTVLVTEDGSTLRVVTAWDSDGRDRREYHRRKVNDHGIET